MTADELRELRRRIDVARRARVVLEALIEKERNEVRLCEFCGALIPPERIGAGRWQARYCQPNHRQYAYLRRKRAAA